jgi:hypothetical protein
MVCINSASILPLDETTVGLPEDIQPSEFEQHPKD